MNDTSAAGQRLPRPRGDHADAARGGRGDDRAARPTSATRRRCTPPAATPAGSSRSPARRSPSALDCRPGEVVFTSGGTESDNLALKGIYWARRAADPRRIRILSTADRAPRRARPAALAGDGEGAEVELLPVDRHGRLDVDALRAADRARPGERRPGLGDVGQQRGRHPPADRRGRRDRRRARHPGAHRRRAGGRRGPGRLRRLRRRRADADRPQGRRPVRRRRARRTPRARGHRAAARRRPGARHPLRHHRPAGDRRLRRRRRAVGQAPGRARRPARGAARRPRRRRASRSSRTRSSTATPSRPAARQRPPRASPAARATRC